MRAGIRTAYALRRYDGRATVGAHRERLKGEDAFRIAEVTLQVVKSMSPLYVAAKPKERAALMGEYKTVLTSYLSETSGLNVNANVSDRSRGGRSACGKACAYRAFTFACALASRASAARVSSTSSISPYAFAASADMKLSRSVSVSICATVWSVRSASKAFSRPRR
jgi:hypothetical protein